MNLRTSLGLAAGAALMACGGSAATGAAAAPSPSNASHVSARLNGSTQPADSHEAGGAAFAQRMGDTGLVIFVFDAATSPSPDCSTLGDAMGVKSGGFVNVQTADYAAGKTEFKIGASMIYNASATSQDDKFRAAAPDGTTLKLGAFDATTFAATLASSPSAKTQLNGSIHGKVCPL